MSRHEFPRARVRLFFLSFFSPAFQDKITNHLARMCVHHYRAAPRIAYVNDVRCVLNRTVALSLSLSLSLSLFAFSFCFAINMRPLRASSEYPDRGIIDLAYRSFPSFILSPPLSLSLSLLLFRCPRKCANSLI